MYLDAHSGQIEFHTMTQKFLRITFTISVRGKIN